MSGPGARHPALLYRDREGFLESLVPFVSGGIDRGEAVFVAARGEYLPDLRDAVGPRSGAAEFVDTEEWHAHPATRARAFNDIMLDHLARGASRLRLVGEPVWRDGRPAMIREWQRYESSLNAVLAPYPVSLACLYDATRLPTEILETARRTHPTLFDGATDRLSPSYEGPEAFLERWSEPLRERPGDAIVFVHAEDLGAMRAFVIEEALRAGAEPDVAWGAATAAHEIVTNAMVHGGGVHGVWAWAEDGRFVCEIRDHGSGIDEPLTGYVPPSAEATSGRGMWLARQLVDLVQVSTGPRGTTVRLSAA